MMDEISDELVRRILDHIQDTANPHLRPNLFIEASATLDFPSVGPNAMATLTISVPGAVVGRPVLAAPPDTFESGFTFSAFVSAADTVEVRIHNNDSGPIDPTSAVWNVAVMI